MTVSIQELERRREDVPSASRADPSGGSSVLVYALRLQPGLPV